MEEVLCSGFGHDGFGGEEERQVSPTSCHMGLPHKARELYRDNLVCRIAPLGKWWDIQTYKGNYGLGLRIKAWMRLISADISWVHYTEMGGGEQKRLYRSICVFCGGNSGLNPAFRKAAADLGKEMVERKIDLIYGGGGLGLMGCISEVVYNGGGYVLGIIPKALMTQEISGEPVGEVKIVGDMHERKSEMARLADAFIALPGGYGTMEELMEMITWCQLGIHDKPVGILNADGYYDGLLALFDKATEEGFVGKTARQIVVSAGTADELLNKLEGIAPFHDTIASRDSWIAKQLEPAATTNSPST